MSRVAGHIVSAIEHETTANGQEQAKKAQLRTAKSLARDAAIDKLSKVMYGERGQPSPPVFANDEAEVEQASREKEKQEEEEDSWRMLTFDVSPTRKRERK